MQKKYVPFLVGGYIWVGLRRVSTPAVCVNATCNNNPAFQWLDGSKFNEYGTVFRHIVLLDYSIELENFGTELESMLHDQHYVTRRVVCQVQC